MLSELREIVERVSKVEDIYQALDIFVKQTCLAMHTECCTVYLANEDMECLELMATQGLKFTGDKLLIGFDEGLVGLVKRTAEPINLAKASQHKEFKYFKQLGEEVYHSFLGAPIIYRKRVLGVLVVQQRLPRLFSEIEVSFLVTLATQLAVIIAHAQTQGHWLLSKDQHTITGVPASSGIAIGELWWDDSQPQLSHVCPASSLDIEREQAWLARAIDSAVKDFRKLRKKLDNDINTEALAIFDLFTHLLNDPMLRNDLKSRVQKGDRADWAVRQVVESYSNRFARMSDAYLRERSQDIRELGQRLLYFLYNTEHDQLSLHKPIILVVRELTATLLAALPKDKLLAVVALEGAANSHAAILSRALGIPSIMGAALNLKQINGKKAIVDGYSGKLYVSPNKSTLAEYRALAYEERQLAQMVNKAICEPAFTEDGVQVEVLLNAGLSADSHLANSQGADGIGLYRSEVSFLLQQRLPSEDEQIQRYRCLLQAYPDKPVVMRTLDVGGDKPLPYLPIDEDNPFLGWRGIRFTLGHPDIFLMQLRAMLRASSGYDNLRILLPMVSGVKELDEALRLIEQAYQESLKVDASIIRPKVGIMLEVPSMLYLLPLIAKKIDFVSVGTNDLTQYLLAVDRNNTHVADVYDAMHPAVIMALKQISQVCQQYALPVCVCGELAGDPCGALLLIGLGYSSLSMNASNVAKVKYLVRHSSKSELQHLADRAQLQPYGDDIHAMMLAHFEAKGFAGFVRAGKQ